MISIRKIRYIIFTLIVSFFAISTYTMADSIITSATREKLTAMNDPKYITAILTYPGIATTTPVTFKAGACPQSKLKDDSQYLLQVINDVNTLPNTYIPKNLVDPRPFIMTAGNVPVCITKTTATQFYNMVQDMKKEGMNLMLVSGYRSFGDQQYLYKKEGPTMNKGQYERVAVGGHSEHQLGTAIDIASMTKSGVAFGTTSESAWIKANAASYGFILSYNENHEEQTGYMYEPWHLRYVGAENAALLNKGDYTLSYKPQFYSYVRMNSLLTKLKEFIQN